MDYESYGPLAYLIGKWVSVQGWTGENRAPDPDRKVENTKFRQEMSFHPIGVVENHEQTLYGLRYATMAWEEGDDNSFHEEVGYWLWEPETSQVMKSFIVPRGISVNAGGTVKVDSGLIEIAAVVGSDTYGICSNKFLDVEFKTIRYDLAVRKIDRDNFSYSEDSQIKIKGQKEVFHHTEKNIMTRSLNSLT